MRKIDVEDRSHIKQLLYCDCVLGVKDHRYRSFGGFAFWWYDKQRDICNCCQAGWSDLGKKVVHYSLDKAARILWRYRRYLFLRGKRFSEDARLIKIGHFYPPDLPARNVADKWRIYN